MTRGLGAETDINDNIGFKKSKLTPCGGKAASRFPMAFLG